MTTPADPALRSRPWAPLSDAEWESIAGLLPAAPSPISPRRLPDRQVLDAMRWHATTGLPWRRLPASMGAWSSAWRRAHWYQIDGTWQRVSAELDRR